MRGDVLRSGSIHNFDPGYPGPSPAAFLAAPPIRPPGVPVFAIDAGTLAPVGMGRLIRTAMDGDHLIGTIAWHGAIDEKAGHGQPSAHCEFAPDGSIRAVVVEIGGDDPGHDDGKSTGDVATCGHSCECGGCSAGPVARFRPK